MQALLESFGYNGWVLPALLAIPLVGALAIWAHGATAGKGAPLERQMSAARNIALAFFLVLFVVSLGLWWSLDVADPGMQARVDLPWISDWGVGFRVGVDGMAAMMVLLTTFIMPLAVLGSWTSVRSKPHAYYALMLVLTTGCSASSSRATCSCST
jgi:NADH-quinone oxidoreductase subunit M